MIYHFYFTNLLQLINDQLQWFFIWWCTLRQLKTVKINFWKLAHITLHCHFIKIIEEPGTSFYLHNRANNKLEIIFISCTNIWPNFILMLPMIIKNNLKHNLYWAVIPMISEMTSPKTPKSEYSRRKHYFFLYVKEIIH